MPGDQSFQGDKAMTPEDAATVPQGGDAKIEARAPGTPGDALIVVPARQTVLFPEIVFPITVNRPLSIDVFGAV